MSATYSLDDLRQKLQNSPYKCTHQRRVVLEVFVNNPGVHLSAEEVHDILKQKSADIGLATVYRALELLCSKEIGILQKIDFGDGCSRYELNLTEPNSHQHHHMICTNCKKVIEFSEDMLDDLEADIMKKCGFKGFPFGFLCGDFFGGHTNKFAVYPFIHQTSSPSMYIVVSEFGVPENQKEKLVNSPKGEYSPEIFRSNVN